MVVAALVVGCSGSEAGPVADPVEVSVAPDASTEEELFTEREGVTAVDDEGQPVEPVTESLPAVAETGVPGIASDDLFCRAWSTYAGSVQALSLSWAVQPEAAAALEVAASSALTRAVAAMSSELPSEIESNRQALTVDVPAPLLRRADRARSLLVEAGLDDTQIDELGDRWVAAITEQGIENENLSIEVPPESATALGTASQAFAAELPSLVEDPTMDTTEFDIGPSLAYIAATCPDQATLAGNDVIESGGP